MAFTAIVKTTVNVLEMLIAATRTITASGNASQRVDLPASHAGVITSGTVTLTTGHGIVTADVVDVYWGTANLRKDCVVGTVAAPTADTAVPLTGGSGDALPSGATAVIVAPQVAIDVDFDGDLLKFLGATCAQRCRLDLRDDASESLKDIDLAAGGEYDWDEDSADENPLAGVIVAEAVASNGSTEAAELIVPVLYESTE